MTMTLVMIMALIVTLTICKILILVMVMMGMNVEGQCRLCFGKCCLCLANVVFSKLAIGWVGGWGVLAEHKGMALKTHSFDLFYLSMFLMDYDNAQVWSSYISCEGSGVYQVVHNRINFHSVLMQD